MLLKMKNIYKTFPGVKALSGVDFELVEGECHGLVGENGAGKSTLIKILSGIQPADSGEIYIEDKLTSMHSAMDARKKGIRAIYQEFSLIPYMSVMENVTMCNVPHHRYAPFFVDWKKMRKDTQTFLDRLGANINPASKINDLGVAERQLVEIAKALYGNAKILIMDEPTAALGPQETARLLDTVEKLKKEGVGIIYISHRLEEVMQVCQRVTVFRDGHKVTTLPIDAVEISKLIVLMVGRKLTEMYPKVPAKIGKETLKVEMLNRKGEFEDISFEVKEGEILGIAGLVGAGRTSLAKAIFGVTSLDSGTVWLDGKKMKINRPQDAVKVGIGYLPEDRKVDGLVLKLNVCHNLTLCSIDKFSTLGWLDVKKEVVTTNEYIESLKIATPDMNRRVVFLSGGNQQKVVVGKWLCSKARVLIFDEPTRGIDVNAKVEIYQIMNELVKQGASVIMISSECTELLGMADRILVMREGKIVSERIPCETKEEDILSDCFCVLHEEG